MVLQRSTRLIFPFILSFSLVACGGSGFSGDSSSSGSTGSTDSTTGSGTSSNPNTGSGGSTGTASSEISTLRLSSSAFQLQSAAGNSVTLSVIAKDQNNVLLDNPNVQISVDNNADLTPVSGSSIKTSELSPGIPDNRLLTVTATSGDKTETLQVEVVGTTVAIEGPDSITLNVPATYKLVARDSGNNPIANRTISLPTVSSGACTIDATGNTLSTAGEFEFSVTGTAQGACTLSTSNFGADTETTINVAGAGDEFTLTSTTDKANDVTNGDPDILEIPVNTNETINIVYKVNGTAVAGKTIQLSSTRGNLSSSSVVTGSNGVASFSISSANSGSAVITASVDGLQAVLKDVEFVADNPVYISTQASPSVVKPLGKSTITTTIKDANNNPVKNKIITFNLNDAVNGQLSSSQAKTDSLGRASVEYTAGNTSSETDGVVITSNVQGSSTITDTINLTVGGNALRIVLGSNNKLEATDLTYTQNFIVIVTDSAGNPVANQNINASLVPTAFYKGKMIPVDTNGDGIADVWNDASVALPLTNPPTYIAATRCISEDTNNNGNLDSGEDKDSDGKLEPTHDATVTGNTVTGADGSVILKVTYPKSRALWSDQKLLVRTTLAGSEYEESASFRLSVLQDDITDLSVLTPNAQSPYGETADCTSSD